MKHLLKLILALCTLMSGPALAESADQTRQTLLSQEGLFQVTISSDMVPLQLGRIHSWQATIRDAGGKPVTCADIKVDGGMPIHNHGFPTNPRVTQELEDGVYLIEGIKFSMRGPWVMLLEITSGEQTDNVAFNIDL